MSTMRRTLLFLCAAAAFSTTAARKMNPDLVVDACATVDCASGLVCAMVIPQSCNVAPCPKLPTCLPKNLTCSDQSCKADETCVLRSVTCIAAPCHPVRQCAKFPKCGANEEYNECSLSGPCEPNCKESFPICSNVTCGKGACECKSGYFRHNGACISKSQCPEPTCDKPNEVWSTCPSACTQTCRTFRGKEELMICPAVCGIPQCTCAVGYVRDDNDNCVKQEDCPKEFKCDSPHEEYKECSSHCEPSCNNRTPSCIDSCGPAKCQCKPGYVRDGSHCLFALQCPLEDPLPDDVKEGSGSEPAPQGPTCSTIRCGGNTTCIMKEGVPVCMKCGKNEKMDTCPNACSESTCTDDVAARSCMAIKMCPPQPRCVCDDGFVRHNGKCVKRSKCPKVDSGAVHILPMPLVDPMPHILPVLNRTNPLTRPAVPDNNGTMHVLPVFNSSWTRPLIRPMYPDNGTVHTMPHLDGGSMHILPFYPQNDDGSVHIMPIAENGTMHIMPHFDESERPFCPTCADDEMCSIKDGKAVCTKCGKNERLDACPNPCSEKSCGDDAANQCVAPRMCFAARCLCDDGFVRNMKSGECVKKEKCPKGDNMHILPFNNHSNPLIRPMFPDNNGSVHIMPVFSNWTRPIFRRPFVPDNGTMSIMPHIENGTMHILPMPLVDPIPFNNRTKPLIRPMFPDNNGTMNILPWIKPFVRPMFPDNENGTMHIMPIDDGKMHILPFYPQNDDGSVHIMPVFNNRTKPLIRPMFPDNDNGTMISVPYVPNFNGSENGTMSILPFIPANNGSFLRPQILPMPQVDPMPHILPAFNRTNPLIRPFFPDNGTAGSGSVHILPFIPKNDDGSVHIMPVFNNRTKPLVRPAFPDNGTMNILPHWGDGSVHTLPFIPANGTVLVDPIPGIKNGTKLTMPLEGAVHTRPFPPPNSGAVHIMPFPVNISTSGVCANHTCPEGSFCEETPVMCITTPCPPIPICVTVTPHGGARDPVVNCEKNEEYSECAPTCQETCRGVECLNKTLVLMCTPGCVCKDNFKRDGHGVCVPNNKCWKTAGCQDNEHWNKCRACEPTCEGKATKCNRNCVSGCACDEGFVRAPTGECIEQSECPK